ncbi:hypothetical protein QOT17_018815 [Balamuthia mandrillaris]
MQSPTDEGCSAGVALGYSDEDEASLQEHIDCLTLEMLEQQLEEAGNDRIGSEDSSSCCWASLLQLDASPLSPPPPPQPTNPLVGLLSPEPAPPSSSSCPAAFALPITPPALPAALQNGSHSTDNHSVSALPHARQLSLKVPEEIRIDRKKWYTLQIEPTDERAGRLLRSIHKVTYVPPTSPAAMPLRRQHVNTSHESNGSGSERLFLTLQFSARSKQQPVPLQRSYDEMIEVLQQENCLHKTHNGSTFCQCVLKVRFKKRPRGATNKTYARLELKALILASPPSSEAEPPPLILAESDNVELVFKGGVNAPKKKRTTATTTSATTSMQHCIYRLQPVPAFSALPYSASVLPSSSPSSSSPVSPLSIPSSPSPFPSSAPSPVSSSPSAMMIAPNLSSPSSSNELSLLTSSFSSTSFLPSSSSAMAASATSFSLSVSPSSPPTEAPPTMLRSISPKLSRDMDRIEAGSEIVWLLGENFPRALRITFDDTTAEELANEGSEEAARFYRACKVPSLLQIIHDLERKAWNDVELGKVVWNGRFFILVRLYLSVLFSCIRSLSLLLFTFLITSNKVDRRVCADAAVYKRRTDWTQYCLSLLLSKSSILHILSWFVLSLSLSLSFRISQKQIIDLKLSRQVLQLLKKDDERDQSGGRDNDNNYHDRKDYNGGGSGNSGSNNEGRNNESKKRKIAFTQLQDLVLSQDMVLRLLNTSSPTLLPSLCRRRTDEHRTLLHLFCILGYERAIDVLLQQLETKEAIRLVATSDSFGCLPLHFAAFQGREDIVRALLQFDVAAKRDESICYRRDCNGEIALQIAERLGHMDVVFMLMQRHEQEESEEEQEEGETHKREKAATTDKVTRKTHKEKKTRKEEIIDAMKQDDDDEEAEEGMEEEERLPRLLSSSSTANKLADQPGQDAPSMPALTKLKREKRRSLSKTLSNKLFRGFKGRKEKEEEEEEKKEELKARFHETRTTQDDSTFRCSRDKKDAEASSRRFSVSMPLNVRHLIHADFNAASGFRGMPSEWELMLKGTISKDEALEEPDAVLDVLQFQQRHSRQLSGSPLSTTETSSPPSRRVQLSTSFERRHPFPLSSPSSSTSSSSAEGGEGEGIVAIDRGEVTISFPADKQFVKFDVLINKEDPYALYKDIVKQTNSAEHNLFSAINSITGDPVSIRKLDLDATNLHEISSGIRLMKEMRHENIVQFLDAFIQGRKLWVVMQGTAHLSLADLIQLGVKFDETLIAYICLEALKGLCHVHAMNRIHNNINSKTVLITPSGQVKITNLVDCSKLGSDSSRTERDETQCRLSSPEQIRAKNHDAKVDVWSVGVLAMLLAEGTLPYSDLPLIRALFLIRTKGAPELKEKQRWGKPFRNFLSHCLRKDHKDRPTALDLLHKHPFLNKAHEEGWEEGSKAVLKALFLQHQSVEEPKRGQQPGTASSSSMFL